MKDYKKFWSNLPHSVCSNEDIASSSDVDGMCWNGHTIDRWVYHPPNMSRCPDF